MPISRYILKFQFPSGSVTGMQSVTVRFTGSRSQADEAAIYFANLLTVRFDEVVTYSVRKSRV